MRFREVRLSAPSRSLPALGHFYGEALGLERLETGGEALAFTVGETRLELTPSYREPFYHFALLAPGDRFAALHAWVREHVELLPDPQGGEVVFDFADWNALACYFHDPAGNIVELIAHRGIGEAGTTGPFAGRELLGVSELGLVGEPRAAAALLAGLGLEVWDGTVEQSERLAFVGERARTLILCPPGRGWLPTRRPAEPHPVEAELSGSPEGAVHIPDSRSTIRRRERDS